MYLLQNLLNGKIFYYDFFINDSFKNANDQGKASLEFQHRAFQDHRIFRGDLNEIFKLSRTHLKQMSQI